MAEEATTVPPTVDAPAPPAPAEPVEPPTANGESTEAPKEDEKVVSEQATAAVISSDGGAATDAADPPPAVPAEDADDATPSSGKKEKRKSVGGVPEHKNKKLNKKKSMPTLHLDAKPGQLYWARLKGYPPWPSVICDEAMLPENLLFSRPVSAARPDGSLRDDYKEGGKNAKDRTFPVMFLSTNEFQWMANTSLTPLDPAECQVPANSKMSKSLKDAWKIASEDHDLEYFKEILKTWQEENARIAQEVAEEEQRKAEERERKKQEAAAKAKSGDEDGKKKKKARKSKGGEDGDVTMEDADAPKSSKKRKNESDGEGGKPKKTPKVTKLNAPKTPNGEEAASGKKSTTKAKKKIVTAPKEEEEDERPQMSEAEKLQQREKAILYLRHRLQKGFLTRDKAPVDTEMPTMADFFTQLEGYEDLEPSIIRNTKIHKVLRGIVKLASIPEDEQHQFKKRSAALLGVWSKKMDADTESAPASAVEAPKEPEVSNGDPATAAAAAAAGAPLDRASIPTNFVSTPDGVRYTPAVDEAKADAPTTAGVEKSSEEVVIEEKAEKAADEIEEKVETVVEEKTDAVPAPVTFAPAEATAPVATDGDVAMQGTEEAA